MDDVRKVLEERRAKLRDEMEEISRPPEESAGISFGKRVGEGTSIAVERLVQVAAHDELRATLADVERALVKLDEGTYGSCDECGSVIPPERLEIRPWAALCVDCASRR
jgi:DnaK suppressor protein